MPKTITKITKMSLKSPPKLTYCVFDKMETENKDIKYKTVNNHRIMKSSCTKCGHRKTAFVAKQTGSGIVDKFIENLPVELHLLGTDEADSKNKKLQFCSPGTKYDMRNARGIKV